MTSSELTAKHVWDFFSTVVLLLISQDKNYKGLILEGKSMVRSYEALPPYVQKQFEQITKTLNEERSTADALEGDTNEDTGGLSDLGGPTVQL